MIADEPADRGAATRWAVVVVLLAAYALSFVDRQILSLLVDDLRRDLHISDTQIGLLQGPAFGVFYAVFGLPLGWLADRFARTRVIAAGLMLWTVATVCSGFAHSFPGLAAARMAVGIGEAALVPAAVSLIADSFPRDRRALPLAVFTGGVSIGAGLALVLGGALVAFARDGAADLVLIGPWLAGRAAWQTVLILAGLAGIPLALVVLALPEPARDMTAEGVAQTLQASGLFAYLHRHRALFGPLLLGTSLLYIFSNALAAWLPSVFVRGFGWAPAMVGVRIGGLVLACALLGNLTAGAWATRMARAGRADATLRVMGVGAVLLAVPALLAPLAIAPGAAQVGVMLVYFALALCFGVATASFVAITPAALRGRMIALYLLVGNLAGLGLGPPAIGLILQHVLDDPNGIRSALALLAVPTLIPGAALLLAMRARHAARANALVM